MALAEKFQHDVTAPLRLVHLVRAAIGCCFLSTPYGESPHILLTPVGESPHISKTRLRTPELNTARVHVV